jgi:hypothetical protein
MQFFPWFDYIYLFQHFVFQLYLLLTLGFNSGPYCFSS